MKRVLCAVVVLIVVVATGFLLLQSPDFKKDKTGAVTLSFKTAQGTLKGTLWPPSDGPVVLLVHGDGVADRFLGGGYLPLMHALSDAGIGVFTWEKPGVGESEGNWLTQSMADRAEEVEAAGKAVQKYFGVNQPLMTIGFSQAGWVIPKLARSEAVFDGQVVIGGAVNWRRQSAYYTRTRLVTEGADDAAVAEGLRQNAYEINHLLNKEAHYAVYVEKTQDAKPMARDRFEFVKKNIDSDATDDLKKVAVPMLALFGEDDLNVDAGESTAVYKRFLKPNGRVVLVPEATHSLLKSALYNTQLSEDWTLKTVLYWQFQGRRAYADGVVETLTEWLKEVEKNVSEKGNSQRTD